MCIRDSSETNDWYQLVGIDQVVFDSIKFEFKGDKIAHIRSRIAPKSERALDSTMNDVVRWALDVDPDEVSALLPRGTFKYGADHAARWMALVKKWKASQE